MLDRKLLLLVFFIVYSRLSAQVGYGPEAGIGMSTMKFAPDQIFSSASSSSVFSWRAGGLIDVGLNKNFYFQAGLMITQKGQSRDFSYYTNDTVNASVKQTLTIYYADLPVNLIYKTGHQGKGRFIAGIGATPSYIIAGKNQLRKEVDIKGTPFISDLNKTVTYRNPVAMFDMGFNLSAGYELPTGLFFRVYYTAGIRDIGLGTEIDKNRIWGISAGYLFGKGRNINKEAEDLIDRTGD